MCVLGMIANCPYRVLALMTFSCWNAIKQPITYLVFWLSFRRFISLHTTNVVFLVLFFSKLWFHRYIAVVDWYFALQLSVTTDSLPSIPHDKWLTISRMLFRTFEHLSVQFLPLDLAVASWTVIVIVCRSEGWIETKCSYLDNFTSARGSCKCINEALIVKPENTFSKQSENLFF